MKKQIVHVAPVQNAKVLAVLYFIVSIPLAVMMWLLPSDPDKAMPWWVLIALPIIYLVVGFVFSLVGAWVYNLVAKQVGGFEFTTAEVGSDDKIA